MSGYDENTICFYSATDAYGCFSNFSRHHIFLKDKKWPTSEHYFQAQKFAGTPYEEQVRATSSPGKSAQMGRSRSLPLRKDWEKVKESIMKDALIAKFTQNKELNTVLLSTAGKTLVEHTEKDSYWGDGGGPSYGKNRLGFLLMEVRDELLKKQNVNTTASSINETTTQPQNEQTKLQHTTEQETHISSESSEEDGEEGEENEDIMEGLEPNHNHTFEVPETAEKKTLGGKKKVKRGGSGKSKSKRSVYRDADGSSKLEKTTESKGNITVIGDGTVFSEKALPPAAKFVVHKHQSQRKYHPTEKDFQDDDEDEFTEEKKAPARNKLSAFVNLKISDNGEPVYEEFPEVPADIAMSADECISAAKSNLELLSQTSDPEIRTDIQKSCTNIKNNMARYIEEFAETGDERLTNMMEQFERIQAVC